jgi:uncharacterized protein
MTPRVKISPRDLSILLGLLEQFLPVDDVWAYGSRVKGASRPNTDLDLVVFTDPKKSRQVADLREALSESALPFMGDLHGWDELPLAFQANIRSAYSILRQAKTAKV